MARMMGLTTPRQPPVGIKGPTARFAAAPGADADGQCRSPCQGRRAGAARIVVPLWHRANQEGGWLSHRMRGVVTLVVGALGLAGCLNGAEEPAPAPSPDDVVARLQAAPPLEWDVVAAVDWWEDFATRFQKRDAYLPANEDARAHLVGELQRIGMETEVREYVFSARGVDGPSSLPVRKYVIIGTAPGETPERVALVSHYDSMTLTLQGAYDDASGVAAQFALCEALTKVPMHRTLDCIFFDVEEQGLESSRAYVADIADEERHYEFILGYDMTGINWPGHDWKMYLMTGGEEHVPVLGNFARDVMRYLAYPESGVEVLDTHDRNSDERRFRDAGVPIYRFAGGRHATDYPEYHKPGDTVEYVYEFVQGRANFELGFATIVEASHALVLALDGTDMAAMRLSHS
jgi:hypothetical protein